MRKNPSFPAWVGWGFLVSYIIACDVLLKKSKKDTLSSVFWYQLRDRWRGPLFVGIWSAVSWHLLVDNPLFRIES